jgi:hypothetical protein
VLFVAGLLLLFWVTSNAGVYRCEGPKGTTFSDRPCNESTEETRLDAPQDRSGNATPDGAAPVPTPRSALEQKRWERQFLGEQAD